MDEIALYNVARWKALAEAGALFTRPKFDLDRVSAKEMVDPNDRLGDVAGRRILCLAGGGGQQSAAFALLGADVTVFDILDEQIQRDRNVAEHYRVEIDAFQGDMRDLSIFENDSFDIVYHPYSINFIPDVSEVIESVSRVLVSGGRYQLCFANPFLMSVRPDSWNGEGYVLKDSYLETSEMLFADQEWVYNNNKNGKIPRSKEFRHRLSDLMNSLVSCGFIIRHVSDSESISPAPGSEPASWDHFVAYAPPWLSVLAVFRPDIKL